MVKVCSKCNENKSLNQYSKSGVRGLRANCKSCDSKRCQNWKNQNRSEYNNYMTKWRTNNPDKQHATEIKRRYGLSIEEYNKILEFQAYCCAICLLKHNPLIKRGRLYVDHCHATNRIRGLLCGSCNSAIGYLEDNKDRLRRAIVYLK